jgi:preprotein translocase subunit SecA
VSFEDDLMRNFGASERMTSMMERFGLKDGEELEHPWLNKSVETAQKRVEQRNYLIRKRTLDFDDVMNKQREVIYSLRNETLETSEPRKLVFEIVDEVIPERVKSFLESPDGDPDYDGLLHWANTTFPLGLSRASTELDQKTPDETAQFLVDKIKQSYLRKVGHEEADAVVGLERYIILNAIDRLWQEHLYAMDGLREGIYLRSYGQKDPLVEYKAEAYDMFSQLMASIKGEVLSNLFRSTTNLMAFEHFLASLPISVTAPADTPQPPGSSPGPSSPVSGPPRPPASGLSRTASRPPRPASGPVPGREKLTLAREKDEADANGEFELVFPASRHDPNKVGRNDPCPCGSGKKFKNCCGRHA